MISQHTSQLPVWGGDTERLPGPVVAVSDTQQSQLALAQREIRFGSLYKSLALLVAGALVWPVVSNLVYWVGVWVGGGR